LPRAASAFSAESRDVFKRLSAAGSLADARRRDVVVRRVVDLLGAGIELSFRDQDACQQSLGVVDVDR
jgi:hypothetical protein